MSPRVSPLDAAQRAIDHTRRALFPFRFERWLLLGFVAFLDQCGRGGASFPNPNLGFDNRIGSGSGGDGLGPEVSQAFAWAGAHVVLLMAIAAGALLLVVLLCALTLWINSRGIFMYLEAVALAPRELGVRFAAHAERAQSLFAWRFGLAMATLIVVLLLVGGGAGLLLLYTREALSGVVLALLVAGLVLVLLVAIFAASLASVFLRDFVAPLQWRQDLACGAAARQAAALLRPHLGALALYVALKIAFAVVFGVATLLAACLTCCCALLPVLGQVVLQPLLFFERAWSLFMIEQLGVRIFEPDEGVALAPVDP
jgi:hypothetical protein